MCLPGARLAAVWRAGKRRVQDTAADAQAAGVGACLHATARLGLFGEPDQERFDPAFGRLESLLFVSPKRSNQEKGDPTVAPMPLCGIGALRCSESGGRRVRAIARRSREAAELAHPCARASTPFPAGFLRYSARHTGVSRRAAFAAEALRPAPGHPRGEVLGLRASALRGHDGRVTGPLPGGERAQHQARRGAHRDVRAFAQRRMRCPRTRGARSRTRRAGCPEGDWPGCPYSLVTFSWASKRK
jgi:hypothetical protein